MVVSTAIDIRQRNKERIRLAIQNREKCTKADISRETSLSMATCSTALNEMLKTDEILKVDQTGFNIGRPADLFTYNRDYMHVLGLCTAVREGQYILEYAIADACGTVLRRRSDSGAAENSMIHESMAVEPLNYDLLEALVDALILEDPKITAVGLGIPGTARDGCIEQCDIVSLKHVDFAKRIREKHNVTVIVENDMNFITYRLYHECTEKGDGFAALYFSPEQESCAGCGIILNGRLVKGANMLAGEVWQVAQAFGISREMQHQVLKDRAEFQKFAAQMVVTLVSTIDPVQITLMGNGLDERDLEEIRRYCMSFLEEKHIPVLRVDNDIFNNYVEGLLRFTLDSVLYPILV